jgi:hypothetical protein
MSILLYFYFDLENIMFTICPKIRIMIILYDFLFYFCCYKIIYFMRSIKKNNIIMKNAENYLRPIVN